MTEADKQKPEAAPKRKAVEVDDEKAAVSIKHSKSSKETSPSKGAKRDNTAEEADGVCGLLMPCPGARKATAHEANSCTPKSSRQ